MEHLKVVASAHDPCLMLISPIKLRDRKEMAVVCIETDKALFSAQMHSKIAKYRCLGVLKPNLLIFSAMKDNCIQWSSVKKQWQSHYFDTGKANKPSEEAQPIRPKERNSACNWRIKIYRLGKTYGSCAWIFCSGYV